MCVLTSIVVTQDSILTPSRSVDDALSPTLSLPEVLELLLNHISSEQEASGLTPSPLQGVAYVSPSLQTHPDVPSISTIPGSS